MSVDPTRHLEMFSPEKFGDKLVEVVGVGATGSHVTMLLAKLGVKNIRVWDDDVIEPHNIANQAFGNHQIGRPKVEAMAELVNLFTGTDIVPMKQKLTGGTKDLGNVVFVLTDTMESRKDIIEKCLWMNGKTDLAIETRMGAELGTVHTINMKSPASINGWKKTWFPDSESEAATAGATACGALSTIGATAQMIASYAVWSFMHWNKDNKIENGALQIALRPMMIEAADLAA